MNKLEHFDIRSKYHVTLGEIIERLERLDLKGYLKNLPVIVSTNKCYNFIRPGTPHSYRGYYTDLAFTISQEDVYGQDFLKLCKECVGFKFEGYKGGEYVMEENTPLWIADYGEIGRAIIDTSYTDYDEGPVRESNFFITTKEVN